MSFDELPSKRCKIISTRPSCISTLCHRPCCNLGTIRQLQHRTEAWKLELLDGLLCRSQSSPRTSRLLQPWHISATASSKKDGMTTDSICQHLTAAAVDSDSLNSCSCCNTAGAKAGAVAAATAATAAAQSHTASAAAEVTAQRARAATSTATIPALSTRRTAHLTTTLVMAPGCSNPSHCRRGLMHHNPGLLR